MSKLHHTPDRYRLENLFLLDFKATLLQLKTMRGSFKLPGRSGFLPLQATHILKNFLTA